MVCIYGGFGGSDKKIIFFLIIRLKLLRLCIIIVNSNNVKSIKWIFVVINFY